MLSAAEIIANFRLSSESGELQSLFNQLNTLRRPSLQRDGEQSAYHDWVLIRRAGVELGFSDANYQSAARRELWGKGDLLLTQAYFYSAFKDVEQYAGKLPLGLTFADSRDIVRSKLQPYEASRRSYRTDTWEIEGYQLSVSYKGNNEGLDRLACICKPAPLQAVKSVDNPSLERIVAAFGESISSSEFKQLWQTEIDSAKLEDATEYGEIDLLNSYGVTLGTPGERNMLFQSVTFHRNRDCESVGWRGELPLGLTFEDSPEVLFSKIKGTPAQRSDAVLTGHSVWHFDDYTLHVLYSNLDNRILRVKLISPGSWKCIEDD